MPNDETIATSQHARVTPLVLPDDWEEGRKKVYGYAIDHAESADLDDMIWAYETDEGTRLQVSISDVGTFLHNRPEIIAKARELQYTTYDGANGIITSMLPPDICTDSLSLKGRKPALTIDMLIENGHILDTRVSQSVAYVRNWSHQVAAEAIAQGFPSLNLLCDLATDLYHVRTRSDQLKLQDETHRISRRVTGSTIAAFIVQECMIAGNVGVPLFMETHDIPGLYRRCVTPEYERAVSRAFYSPNPGPHDGLRLEKYSHSTSPLRRFADVINHLQLTRYLGVHNSEYSHSELTAISQELNGASEDEIIAATSPPPARETIDLLDMPTQLTAAELGDFFFGKYKDTELAPHFKNVERYCNSRFGNDELRLMMQQAVQKSQIPDLETGINRVVSLISLDYPRAPRKATKSIAPIQCTPHFNRLRWLPLGKRLAPWICITSEDQSTQTTVTAGIRLQGKDHIFSATKDTPEEAYEAASINFITALSYQDIWRITLLSGDAKTADNYCTVELQSLAEAHGWTVDCEHSSLKQRHELQRQRSTVSIKDTSGRVLHTTTVRGYGINANQEIAAWQLLTKLKDAPKK